jgi:hypothetical protein
VVTLYQGGEYWLYRSKKYTDVRIVFAPEQQIAYFGGDPDNFTYPRYDLDMAVFRVYENGKPLETTNFLKWNAKGAANGELVFVSGHPGTTSRLDTMAQVLQERDLRIPLILEWLQNRLQVTQQYAAGGPEQARQAEELRLILENSLTTSAPSPRNRRKKTNSASWWHPSPRGSRNSAPPGTPSPARKGKPRPCSRSGFFGAWILSLPV